MGIDIPQNQGLSFDTVSPQHNYNLPIYRRRTTVDHPITRNITPLTNTERLIRWRAEYTALAADVDRWLMVLGHTSEARAKMLALPPPGVKPQPNSISAYLRS